MYVVRQHTSPPEQPVAAVGVHVGAALGEQPADLVDLRGVLVDVRGEQRTVDVAQQRLAGLQHRRTRREREPWRDGVAQPVLAVPSACQRQPVGVRLLRGDQQLVAQQPVADHQPGADPQLRWPPPARTGSPPLTRNAPRKPERSWCLPRSARRRTRRPPRARSRRRPSGLPRAAHFGPASPVAACRARRSPAPGGSGHGCPPDRAAPHRRSGRPPRPPGAPHGSVGTGPDR